MVYTDLNMAKLSNKNKSILTAWSSLYVVVCCVIMYSICTFCDLTQRSQVIFVSIGILSILIWFVLLVGFTKYDGSNNTWWSKLLYDLYPYPDRKKTGNMFRDIVFPTFFWSFFFFLFSFPLLFFCIIIVCLVGYVLLYNPIDFLISSCQSGFYALVSLVIIVVMLAIIHSCELKNSNIRFNRLAILRTLFGINIYIIGYVLLLTGITEGCNDVLAVFYAYRSEDLSLMLLCTGIVKPFINLLPGSLLLYYCRRNLNILLYVEDQYLLYLRSFQYDEKEDYLMSLLPVGEKQIMKIGNPSDSLLSNFFSNKTMYHDVLFLPSSNWKKHLDYYIHKAYSVISVVDDTQGVVWEMFHHSEYYNKIVFWVDSIEKLSKLKDMIAGSTESDLSPQLYYCIQVLNDREMSFPFVFWIKDNRCYYETDVKIVSTLLSAQLNYTSQSFFDINTQMDMCVLEEKTKKITYYEDWNNISKIVSKISKILNLVNTKLPWGLFAFMFLCSILFCITLMIGAVCASVAFIFEGDVRLGIICLIFSISFIAMSVFGWYKMLSK